MGSIYLSYAVFQIICLWITTLAHPHQHEAPIGGTQVTVNDPQDDITKATENPLRNSYSKELSQCPYSESKIVLTLMLQSNDWDEIVDNNRNRTIQKLSKFFSVPKKYIKLESSSSSDISEMMKKSIRRGPKNINENEKKLGKLEFAIGCGQSYFAIGGPISNQIATQMKEGIIDDITGLNFGWWVIWKKKVSYRVHRFKRNAGDDGSGDNDYFYDDDYEDDEDEGSMTEAPVVPMHPHRHHHGVSDPQYIDINNKKTDAPKESYDQLSSNNIDRTIKHKKNNSQKLVSATTDSNILDGEDDITKLLSDITKTIENTNRYGEAMATFPAGFGKDLLTGTSPSSRSTFSTTTTHKNFLNVDDIGDYIIEDVDDSSEIDDYESVTKEILTTIPSKKHVQTYPVTKETPEIPISVETTTGYPTTITTTSSSSSSTTTATTASPTIPTTVTPSPATTITERSFVSTPYVESYTSTSHDSTNIPSKKISDEQSSTISATIQPLTEVTSIYNESRITKLTTSVGTTTESTINPTTSLPLSSSSQLSSQSSSSSSSYTTFSTTPLLPLLLNNTTTSITTSYTTLLTTLPATSSYGTTSSSTSYISTTSDQIAKSTTPIDSNAESGTSTSTIVSVTKKTPTEELIKPRMGQVDSNSQTTAPDEEDYYENFDGEEEEGTDEGYENPPVAQTPTTDQAEITQKTTPSTTGTTTVVTEPPTTTTTTTEPTTIEITTPTTTTTTTTTTQRTTTTTLPTTEFVEPEPENTPPLIKNRLPKQPLTAGKPFSLPIPLDTFYDKEDGSNLKLELFDKNRHVLKPNSWIQFNPETREIYGLPVEDTVSKYQYILTATDSKNESVSDTLEISVQQHKSYRTHNHEITLQVKINKKFTNNIDWQIRLIRGIVEALDDTSMANVVVREIRQNPLDPHSAAFVYTNESLPKDKCPEKELNDLVERLQKTNVLNNALHPEITVKGITAQQTGPCLKPAAPKPKPTHSTKNYQPVPRNQVDRVNATVGQLLVFKVPSDTFYDPEDNTDLKLNLMTMDREKLDPNHWLQFDSKNQEFFGVPKYPDHGTEEYLLVAEDSGGLTATDALIVIVTHLPKRDYTVLFKMVLGIPYNQFNNAFAQRKFVERLAQLFGDSSTSNIHIRSIHSVNETGQTIVSFHNTTLYRLHHRCPEEEVEQLRNILLNQDSIVRDEVKKAIGNEFNLEKVTMTPTGSCHFGDTVSHEVIPIKAEDKKPSTIKDAYILTYVLPAVIILAMLLLASIIACVLHRRRLTGKMELGDEEERRSFRSKGIPVIFQDELDEKPEIGNKSPIILKDEKPPLLPPSYNSTNLDGDNDVDEYVPPPAVVVGGREVRGKSPVTPSYRKPPPYVSP